jgi:hypothetical protein
MYHLNLFHITFSLVGLILYIMNIGRDVQGTEAIADREN